MKFNSQPNDAMEMTTNYSGDIFTHIKKAAAMLGRPIKNERVCQFCCFTVYLILALGLHFIGRD